MNDKSQSTYPTAEADAAMQGQRKRSMDKTIETAVRTAQCPKCNEHPTDCICYKPGMQPKIAKVQTWRPYLMKDPIYP